MALVACPECARQISTLAACPHCGYPMQLYEPQLSKPGHKSTAGEPLQEYQTFIDGLLEWPRVSVRAKWAREWDNKPPTSTYRTPADFDAKMRQFTSEQRQVVADLMQEEHEGGIGTFFAYLERLQLYRDGIPLATEPYGMAMSYDWTCRMAGSSWPESEDEA